MSTQKKILIIHATGGLGHVKAAEAIQDAFQKDYSGIQVKNINVLDFAPKLYQKIFADGYNMVSSKLPEFWGWLYRHFDKELNQKLPRILSQIAIESKLIPFILEYSPDFIISTHPLPMRIVSHSKNKHVIGMPSSIVVTDFGCHSFWVDPEVDYYFVAAEGVKQCLTGYGVHSKKVIVTGIPIEKKFSHAINRVHLIKDVGLDPDRPIVLVVGGQLEYKDLLRVIRETYKKNPNLQFMVVAGRDKEFERNLLRGVAKNSILAGNRDSVKIFGFVNNMEELMSAADIIFSKAGGLTVSECMSKELPMIIHKVIPGQEEDNVRFLVNQGAAVQSSTISGIIQHLWAILGNKQKIQTMKTACKKIGKPDAARTLADFVNSKL